MNHYDLSRLKVLLVDDSPYMHTIMRAILVSMGIHQVKTCLTAEQGFVEMETFKPDLVITDWMMEPIDGIEFTRRIRAQEEGIDRFLPIFILSGHTEEWRVRTAVDAGVNDFVAKPVSATALYKRIVNAIERPLPFIRMSDYLGPDRRRKQSEFEGEDRRGVTGPLAGRGVA